MTAYEGEMDIRQVSQRCNPKVLILVIIVAGSHAANGGELPNAFWAKPSM